MKRMNLTKKAISASAIALAFASLSITPVEAHPITTATQFDTVRNTVPEKLSASPSKVVEATKHESLLAQKDGRLVVSDLFMKNAGSNFVASDYSYALTKGNTLLSDQHLTKLNQMGWEQIGIFSALEGAYLNFGDVAGVVLYNRLQNMYDVVFRGTATNQQGWETNMDSELISSEQIRSEIIGKIRDELIFNLREEKSFRHFFGHTNGNLDSLIKFVKSHLTTDMSIGELIQFKDTLKTRLVELLPKIANKVDQATKTTLLQTIDSIFAVKIEMLRNIHPEEALNYKGKAHRGDALKVASAMPEIVAIMKRHANRNKNLAQARMMVHGHSMGGALAKIFAASFEKNFEIIFGRRPIATRNDILVHTLSAAPTGDYTFKRDLEKKVGIANIADQKVDNDMVPKADPASYTPDVIKMALAKLPFVGKAIVGKIDSDYALQIGTPLIDKFEDVEARANLHFPGKKPGFFSPLKKLLHNNLVLPHYGITLGDDQGEGQNYGRTAHFEPALATPLNGIEGYNAMLQLGIKNNDSFNLNAYPQAEKV